MNMQRITILWLLLAILGIGVSAKPLPSNEDLLADMLVLVNSTKLERHMDTRSVEGSGDDEGIPIQHLSSSVMERMEQAPPQPADARESLEGTSNDGESVIETLQDEGSGIGGIGFEAKGMLEEPKDLDVPDEKEDMKNEEVEAIETSVKNEPISTAELKEYGSGEHLEENAVVEDTQIEAVSNIENIKNVSVEGTDEKAAAIVSESSNIVEEQTTETSKDVSIADDSDTEQEKQPVEGENDAKNNSDVEVKESVAVEVSTEAILKDENEDKSSEQVEEVTESVAVEVSAEAILKDENEDKSSERVEPVTESVAVEVSAEAILKDENEGSEQVEHVTESVAVKESAEAISKDENEDKSSEIPTAASEIIDHVGDTEIVKNVEIPESSTSPSITDIISAEEPTEATVSESHVIPDMSFTEPPVESVETNEKSPTLPEVNIAIPSSSEASAAVIEEDTVAEENIRKDEATITSSIIPEVPNSSESSSTESSEQKSDVNADEVAAVESSTEISTASEANVDLVGNISGTFVQKASLQVPHDKNEVANDSSVVQESSIAKSLSMYVVAGILAIIFIALVIMFTVRYRGRRRRMRPENGSEKDTDNPLLSNGKYKEDSEDNNIKNNEITPLVIKNTSQINKFEKSPNFSSQKNINTIANEKNIEKDNVLKSNQTIIEDEDDAKKCVEDDVDEEKKKLAEEKEPPSAEKVIVRTRVDVDSIPRKPVIVNRNGHNYQSVPGGDTET